MLDVRCYNGFGQLASVNRDMAVTRYQYRPDGLRHSAETDGRKTVYHWDGQNLVRESNGDGGTKATYLRGAQLIAQVIDCTLFYYLLNAHGDVVQRVSGNKLAAPRYEYDAFGVQRERVGYSEAKDPNPLRYCGEYWDSDTQELYLRARTYQPRNGRFTQEDPAKDGGNWYSYCGGNPVTRTDPSGLWTSAFWEEQLISQGQKAYDKGMAEKARRDYERAALTGSPGGSSSTSSGTQSVPTWDFGEPGGYIPPSSVSVPSGGGMQGRPGQYSNELPTSTNPRSSHNPNSYFANPDSRYNMSDALGAAIGGAWNDLLYALGRLSGLSGEDVTVWAGEGAEFELFLLTLDALLATGAVIGGGFLLVGLGAATLPAAHYTIPAAVEGMAFTISGMTASWADVITAVQYLDEYGGFTVTGLDTDGLLDAITSYFGTSVERPQLLDSGSARHQARIANRGR